jgi:subtilisin family serine protease/chitodextrinase
MRSEKGAITMKARNRIGVIFFVTFSLLASIAAAAQGNTKKVEINGFVIDVKKVESDDTVKVVVGKEKDKSEKWIVQFTGPIYEAEKKQLLDMGCRINDYVPEFAFIVTMNEETQKRVEKLPFIEGVVRYKPEYKIDKKLQEKIGKKEIKKFHIRVDSAENLPVLLSAVLKQKGKILDVGRDVARVQVEPGAINKIANLEEVLWIEEAVDLKLLNDITKWTIQTYIPNNTKIWNKGIHGEGEIVGIGDTGLDYDMPWFYDPSGAPIGPTHRKVVGYTSYADDYDGDFGHGTHVAGTVGGNRTPVDGLSNANGMAPMCKLFMEDLTPGESYAVYPPSDLGLLFITPYYAGARLHTNSWGASENVYDTYARTADLFMWQNKDFLAFFANGNSGDGEGTVGTPANAKNVVSVGASENGLNAENVASFSSNGPTADGRIKPTVTAPGVNIVSADSDGIKNSFNSGTTAMSGTSMATPAVAGAAALVRQYYEDGFWAYGTADPAYGFEPSAALVKATLINSAQNMTGYYTDAPIPSTGQGWGRINLSNTLHFFGDNKFLDVADVTTGLQTGTRWSQNYFASGDRILKVTLVWTDYPGTEGAARELVNDLDLSVTAPGGSTYNGNVFQNGVSVTGGGSDKLNVVEQVLIPPAFQSGNYIVTATGYNVPFGPQPFAVVVTGAVSITSAGFIYLDKPRYKGSDTVKISVADRDLNHNSTVAETVSVIIKSTTEPGGEAVQLVESGTDTAIFTGTINIRSGGASNDGYLEVADGDTITAVYNDEDDGTGKSAIASATALADLTPPFISEVTTQSVDQDTATITWTTSEPASATVNYGETRALGASRSDSWLMTSHAVTIGNLKENTTYYYEVDATDEAGNVSSDNNGGALYAFTTLNLPPDLSLYSSNFTETYQPETVIYGTATDPSGVATVLVNGQPASYRPSDGYYELTVPLVIGENIFTVIATDNIGNSQTRSITVIRLVPPDLEMTSVVGPAKGGFAEPIHIENTVCNIGLGTSPGTGLIAWYLSKDNVISPAEDAELSLYYDYMDDIRPGECISIPVDIRLTLPTGFGLGTYYLGAYVDCSDEIWEPDEKNNIRVGNQITVEGPDLVVSSLSAPSSALKETAFTVSNTVANIGLGASWPSDFRIYLSTDPIITLSDIEIGRRQVGWLEADGSPYPYPSQSSDDTVVTIPSSVASGTYYIGAIVDPYNLLKESNETNNAVAGNQITITTQADSDPPSVPTNLSGTAMSSTRIDLSWSASTDTGGSGLAGYHIYRDGTMVGTTATAGYSDTGLTPNTTYNYRVSAYDNAGNESAQCTVVPVKTPGDTGGVTINPTTVSVTEGGATASYTVVLTSQPSANVTITVSPDSQVTVNKTALSFRKNNWNVPQSVTVTAVDDAVIEGPHTGTITHSASSGGYDGVVISSVTAYITDNDTGGGPDLVMSSLSHPAWGAIGGTITVNNTVANMGDASSGGFYVGIYLSTDQEITNSDTLIGQRFVAGLAAGASSTAQTTATVPSSVGTGTYYIGAIADDTNSVAETVETNNAVVDMRKIRIK